MEPESRPVIARQRPRRSDGHDVDVRRLEAIASLAEGTLLSIEMHPDDAGGRTDSTILEGLTSQAGASAQGP